MGELAPSQVGALIRELRSPGAGLRPYASELTILRTHVAGTSHNPWLLELLPYLRPGERFDLVRMPDNPSDPNAIRVCTRDGVKLGYLPREDNRIPANLLDGGKDLRAALVRAEEREGYLLLEIDLLLLDD